MANNLRPQPVGTTLAFAAAIRNAKEHVMKTRNELNESRAVIDATHLDTVIGGAIPLPNGGQQISKNPNLWVTTPFGVSDSEYEQQLTKGGWNILGRPSPNRSSTNEVGKIDYFTVTPRY